MWLRYFFQACQTDRLQIAVPLLVERLRAVQPAFHDVQQHDQQRRGPKWRPAWPHVVENSARAVEIHNDGQPYVAAALIKSYVARRPGSYSTNRGTRGHGGPRGRRASPEGREESQALATLASEVLANKPSQFGFF